jgi:Fe-S-cluster containining protein
MDKGRLDNLASWTKWRPTLCRGCSAGCCTLPVEATAADLIRLGLASQDEFDDSPKRLAKRLIAEGHVETYRVTTGRFTLARTPSGDCLYLDATRRCTAYDRRPNVCRRFPEVGPKPGYCPRSPFEAPRPKASPGEL